MRGWLSGCEAGLERVEAEVVCDVLRAVDGMDLPCGAGANRITGGRVSHANCTPAWTLYSEGAKAFVMKLSGVVFG